VSQGQEELGMNRFPRRWAVSIVGISLLIIGWSIPAQAWADGGTESQTLDSPPAVLPTLPALTELEFNIGVEIDVSLTPELNIRARIDFDCSSIDGTALCLPPIDFNVTVPISLPD
jgi:hypothetical protein